MKGTPMRKVMILLILLAPTTSFAQSVSARPEEAAAAPPVEMVLLPRSIAEDALQWIRRPDIKRHIDLYATLMACINDNPHGGQVVRVGPDQCLPVTQALAEANKKPAAAAGAMNHPAESSPPK